MIYKEIKFYKLKKSTLTSVILCLAISGAYAQNLLPYVQPLSGTAASTTLTALKHSEGGSSEKNANTIPSVGLPFGMTQWTAQTQTGEAKCLPPYLYKSNKLSGFRATHWISGSCMQDYGSFTVMPITGKLQTKESAYAANFSHQDEISTPAFYQVKIPRYNLKTEMTATLRSAMLQFTVAKTDSLYLLIMPNSDQNKGFIKVDQKRGEVYGYNPVHRIYQGWGKPAGFSGYFVIKIEKLFTTSGTFSNDQVLAKDMISNKENLGAYLGFKLKKGEVLRIKVGTSFTDIEGARKNLAAEISNWDFETLVKKNSAVWQNSLSQITIQSQKEKDKRIFYTALYHSMQHPRLYNDIDGRYPRFAGNYEIEKLKNGNYYDDFSMWDIYRAQLPLMEILKPNLVNNWIGSMVLKGTQGSWLPIFPCWNNYTAAMIGDHVTAFISSAYTKGIKNYDINEAYRLMRQNAFDIANIADYKNGMGRRALPSYLKYGYIPMQDSVPDAFHKKEQVSRTLEYAYDDYALAKIAKSLGKTEDYNILLARSKNYENVFDPNVKMVRGRNADGTWYQPFNANVREPYITEGTPRQYTFYVPHDVPGLATLMGGQFELEKALDSLFEKDEYWHGNEPGHQIPFMYNYTASPWKASKEVHRILNEEYNDGPGGLSGNDDAGQMSAWYVFASMGFYPVDPVSGEYLVVVPTFNNTKIKLNSNRIFEIVKHQKTAKSSYIKSMKLNGKPYLKTYIKHSDLMKGGKLEFFLKDQPSQWGKDVKNQPAGL
ncbi:glycoside hydrolase family 92 protein [Pedobacter sp. LMG 31464]|uniref:Glycoside hydrolase family 92 protein n=2 Tax=Pedobacter planticolens TaxID=2679964 RepID=A0A923IUH6_9SPHI|nr:glycoside hydrolase family 92 protein [Pedobacter planticolens]